MPPRFMSRVQNARLHPEVEPEGIPRSLEPPVQSPGLKWQRGVGQCAMTGSGSDSATGVCASDRLCLIGPAMAAYRTLMMRKPVDKAFMIGNIDRIIPPAAGVRSPDARNS